MPTYMSRAAQNMERETMKILSSGNLGPRTDSKQRGRMWYDCSQGDANKGRVSRLAQEFRELASIDRMAAFFTTWL